MFRIEDIRINSETKEPYSEINMTHGDTGKFQVYIEDCPYVATNVIKMMVTKDRNMETEKIFEIQAIYDLISESYVFNITEDESALLPIGQYYFRIEYRTTGNEIIDTFVTTSVLNVRDK